MSGPVSENGIFLNDNVRIRKALEEDRRILRLQQVRQESKNLSRKLRNEVTAEKERQIRKLQAIKEKESELWRHAVLKQKYGDYREAVYHIGDAHKNARIENNARKAAIEANRNKCQNQESLFHRQVRARQTYGYYKPPPPPPPSKNSHNTKRFKRKCFKTKKQLNTLAINARQRAGTTLKRKRHCCCHNHATCNMQYECLESHDEYDNCYLDDEVYSCCLSPTSNVSDVERENMNTPERHKLKKTAPVLLEVEDGFNFGATQNASEMKDKYVKDNRQFSHVVRATPEKRLKPATKPSQAAAVNTEAVDEQNLKKHAEKHKVEPIKLPRLNKVSKLIEKLDAERESNRSQMPTTSAVPMLAPLTTGTDSETYNTLAKITTISTEAQQPQPATTSTAAAAAAAASAAARKEEKRSVGKPVQQKIIRAPVASPSTTAQKPATKAIASKATAKYTRGRTSQRPSTAVAVRKEKPRSSAQSATVENYIDEDDVEEDDDDDNDDMQPSGSQQLPSSTRTLREKSPNVHQRSPQRISIHSTATGSVSITVDQPGNDSTPAELMETVIERQLPTAQQPSSEPRKLESRYDIIQREREQACRELKTLSDKLASLARDCTATVPTAVPPEDANNNNGGVTYRVAPKASIEQEATISNVAQVTTVDRASSPTLPVTTQVITEETQKPSTTTKTTEEPTPTTSTKASASAAMPTFKKPSPLPRINYREIVADKGTKNPTKIQTSIATRSPTKAAATSPIKTSGTKTIATSPIKTTTRQSQNSQVSSSSNTKTKDSTLTSSSYSFIMLDYVADQSKLLGKDLNDELKRNQPNRNKCEKLQILLERNEKLCRELHEKLEGRSSNKRQLTANNNEEIKNLISAVCELRKEREELLNADILNTASATTKTTATTSIQAEDDKKRELELQKREEALTKQLSDLQQQQEQFLKQLQQPTQGAIEKTQTLKAVLQQEHANDEDPVEIVITVKGAKPLRKSTNANNMEKLTTNHVLEIKTPNIAATTTTTKRKSTAQQSTPSNSQQQQQRSTPNASDNTYDSTSTHYRSLPQKLHVTGASITHDNDDNTLNNIVMPNDEVACRCPHAHNATEQSTYNGIHPIVAQYVDRLLNMRRSSVRALGVSMSDMETPSESLINITTNETRIADELRDTQAHVSRVERFIEENYAFIQDLEHTLASQQSISLEKSMVMVEELWKQYFKKTKSKKQKQSETKITDKSQEQSQDITEKSNVEKSKKLDKNSKQKTHEQRVNETISEAVVKLAEANKNDTNKKCNKSIVTATTAMKTKTPEKASPTKTAIDKVVRKSCEQASTSKAARISTTTTKTTAATAAAVAATITKKKTKIQKPILSTFDSHESKNHFHELASSCTKRITELNGMLARVREEKQRLLESTYSSVSLGSTEIVAPPPTRSTSAQEVADSKKETPEKVRPKTPAKKQVTKQKQQHVPEEEEEEVTTSSSMRPLPDRNAAIAGSRDSGIGGSRPVTRQEQLPPQAQQSAVSRHKQLPPQKSSASATVEVVEEESTTKHGKPPATLKRYSPQLINDVEATTAHELSTIVEVETPITSRLNTHADGDEETEERQADNVQPTPAPFPEFEQYLQTLQLDLTRINPELSFQLGEQFDDLVKTLTACDSRGVPRYTEFPCITGYLQNITQMESIATEEPSRHQIDDTIVEELINCLRLANLTARSFPSQREYTTQHMCRNSPASEILDTASLENLSEGTLDSDSDTLNIEQELQKRHLLHYAFNSDSKHEDLDISITTRHTTSSSQRKSPRKIKNTNASLLQETNEHMGTGNWAATMRRRIHETNALSSGTSSSPDMQVKTTEMLLTAAKQNYLKNRSTTDSVGEDTMGGLEGRNMNLRDFLHREISRYSHSTTGSSSSNTTSTDYSLRKQFFQSILDSMTPQTQPSCDAVPAGSKNTYLSSTLTDHIRNDFKVGTQSNLTRQKTSTPVPANSTKSTNTTHGSQDSVASTLFSCESHISQVAAITNNERQKIETNQEYQDKTKRKKR